jgi:hypothetical protein
VALVAVEQLGAVEVDWNVAYWGPAENLRSVPESATARRFLRAT